jgi:hypothetical protein
MSISLFRLHPKKKDLCYRHAVTKVWLIGAEPTDGTGLHSRRRIDDNHPESYSSL